MLLTGKVAIITASTSGIGFGIAKRFVQEGCNVMLSSRSIQNVEEAVNALLPLAKFANCKVIGITCDLLNDEDLQHLVDETLKQFGQLDVLVAHTASESCLNLEQQIIKMTDDEWDKTFNEIVRPPRRLAQIAFQHLQKRGGSIIFVAQASAYSFPALFGLYSVAKATLIASMKAMVTQAGSFNIRVNCVTPGIINTKFSETIRADKPWSDRILKNTALGRFGESHDVAGVAVFLASDYSSYVSGESIITSGGHALSHF